MDANGWISVEDRLPEVDADGDGVAVLFLCHYEYRVGWPLHGSYDNLWEDTDGGTYYGTTHWQPLPPPPVTTE